MSLYKPKGGMTHIFILMAALAIILLLMMMINKQRFKFPVVKSRLSEFSEDAKVLDNTYYNKPFRFSIAVPDSNWLFSYNSSVDSTLNANSTLENPQNMVTIFRLENSDTIAVVKVGLFMLRDLISPQKLAALNMAQVKNNYKVGDDEVTVVGEVTPVSSGNLYGAFYVVELPLNTPQPYPVWVTMFMLRDRLAYRIFCQAKRDKYEPLRTDLEEVLKNFRFL